MSLSCGAVATEMGGAGATRSSSSGSPSARAATAARASGGTARGAIRVERRKIKEWYRLPDEPGGRSRRRRRRRAPRCERRRRPLRRPRQPAGARRGPRRRRLRAAPTRSSSAATSRPGRCPPRSSTAWPALDLPVRWVRGNADREVVAHFDRGDTDPSVYGPDAPAERADAFTAARITRAHRDLMAGFEDVVRLDGALYCHGSPRSDDEIITAADARGAARADAGAAVAEALVVCGHTHHQFELRAGDAARRQRRQRRDALRGPGRRVLAAGRRRRARAAAHATTTSMRPRPPCAPAASPTSTTSSARACSSRSTRPSSRATSRTAHVHLIVGRLAARAA